MDFAEKAMYSLLYLRSWLLVTYEIKFFHVFPWHAQLSTAGPE